MCYSSYLPHPTCPPPQQRAEERARALPRDWGHPLRNRAAASSLLSELPHNQAPSLSCLPGSGYTHGNICPRPGSAAMQRGCVPAQESVFPAAVRRAARSPLRHRDPSALGVSVPCPGLPRQSYSC